MVAGCQRSAGTSTQLLEAPCAAGVETPRASRRSAAGRHRASQSTGCDVPGALPRVALRAFRGVEADAYSGLVATTSGSPVQPGAAPGATLAPARPTPDLDDGDHDRMAHIVLEGYTPKAGGEFVSLGPSVVEGMVNQTPVRALCGKEWVPGRDPARYGLCPTCKEIAESMGWELPVR